jgi:hypothetical protein
VASASLGSPLTRMLTLPDLRPAWAICGLVLALVGPACHSNSQSQGQSLCSTYCEKLASCSVEAGQLSADAGASFRQAVGFCENVTCLCPDQSDVLTALSACASLDCTTIGGSTGLGGATGEGGSFGTGGSVGSIGAGGSM